MTNLQQDLNGLLAPQRVLMRAIDLIAYASDASVYRLIPRAVVQPSSIAEVQRLLRYCREQRLPVTFRAAGTSLSGQAVSDSILVDLSQHWRQYEILDNGKRVRVQPGIVGGMVNNLLRPFGAKLGPDPASINACMIGGILANNASGMCCGVSQNSYHTLESLTMVLPDGTQIDTAAPEAARLFGESQPELAAGLAALRQRLLADTHLQQRIRSKYLTKNTTGYSLNAFLDYEQPLDILRHLLIGSEGTLAFIAEAVLRTVPDLPLKYTGMLYFPDIQAACDAIVPLREAGAAALELMDRASLRSVEDQAGAPAALRDLPETAAAILAEFQSAEAADLANMAAAAARICAGLRLLQPPVFSDAPSDQAALWRIRKGLFPSVGAVRQLGTSVIIEDVVFPVERLAGGVTELQALFARHGYDEAIIFGHAREGNLHFVITQSFHDQAAIAQYDSFIRDVVELVVNGYDGALKAEHGTGRNMAPFVETEWGPAAYAVMSDLKQLVDPDGLLNPGVIINRNAAAHIENLKSLPTVDPEADTCIECGFCEPKCPSRDLTLTPRQRIVVRREVARLRGAGASEAAAELLADYPYDGLATCAADGLCATACPVGIDTGQLVKRLRSEASSDRAQARAMTCSRQLHRLEALARTGLRLGHLSVRWLGRAPLDAGVNLLRRLFGDQLPAWVDGLPLPAPGRLPSTERAGAAAVYVPACLTRTVGQLPGEDGPPLAALLILLARRAGVPVWLPADCAGTCCGTPFASKGYHAAYCETVNAAIERFWDWSDQGRLPIVIDTSPCTYTLRRCHADLTAANRARWQQLRILDSIEFVHDQLLPGLQLRQLDREVAMHPVCSAVKLGLADQLETVMRQCARTVTVPVTAGCCGFAGDRGLIVPELTAAATAPMAAELASGSFQVGYSSSRMCEVAMSKATGRVYQSFLYLVERASRADQRGAPPQDAEVAER